MKFSISILYQISSSKDNFLKIKQEASGYPSWCQSDSEKEKFIRDYEEAEGVRLDPSSIQKNPGRRAFAKIMLNLLKERDFYFDTDSCMYIHDPKLWNPPIINSRLGKWTDGEPDSKITKVKGIT